MKRVVLALAAALSLFAGAQTASATTLLTPGCNLLTGCKFDGNDTPLADVISAYNSQTPPPSPLLTLTFLSKLDADLGQINGTSGVAVSPTPFNFYVVKAGDEFWLYKLSNAATSVAWNTNNLINNAGKAKNISHLSFYQGNDFSNNPGIPEPGTWAMMIGGFGLAGGALRRRRAFAAA